MEKIFEKGDRVFCIICGWGTVIERDKGEYPIRVEFDNGNSYTYSENGRINNHTPPTLSFTEYTLEGFSQERPEPLPKRGDIVWVKDGEGEEWRISHFIEKVDKTYIASVYNNKTSECYWRYITTNNPHANEQ